MRWLRQLWVRRRMYDDLAEEMQQHLEEKIENLVGSGMARKEAEGIADHPAIHSVHQFVALGSRDEIAGADQFPVFIMHAQQQFVMH